MTDTHTIAHIPDEAVKAFKSAFHTGAAIGYEAQIKKALTAAIPHLSAPCVAEVKKLEWNKQNHSDITWVAKTPLGNTQIWLNKDGFSDEQAKAAAQADFERRILSCVVTMPVDVAAVLEKLARAICLSYGYEPDDYASIHDVCGKNNEPLPQWHMYTEQAEAAIRALSAEPAQGEQWQPTHRHVKRGTEYQLIGTGKMQAENWQVSRDGIDQSIDMQEVAIYRGDDGQFWVRPIAEFNNGRFEALPAAPTSEAGQ